MAAPDNAHLLAVTDNPDDNLAAEIKAVCSQFRFIILCISYNLLFNKFKICFQIRNQRPIVDLKKNNTH